MQDFDSFLLELKSRIVLSECIGKRVIWDQRKSRPSKGDYWACCPFHQEKSSSFHVEDSKGFYYCFGCHASGDAFSFLQKLENKNFMEVVEELSGYYGLTVPQKKYTRCSGEQKTTHNIYTIMEEACNFYAQKAGQIKDFFLARNLTPNTVTMFSLGYAPPTNGSDTLYVHLKKRNFRTEQMIEAGLVAISDDSKQVYDRFRHRVIFPIKDKKGRCIAFGGRALSKTARAKYLNSPETPVFHKGKTLYNFDNARKSFNTSTSHLIVTEGYMDVIALSQAGFKSVVAPLGTAITPEQLLQLWQLSDNPVIAMDGDAAGRRASEKLATMALEYVAPGKTLQFIHFPEGQDPDDIVNQHNGKEIINTFIKNSTYLSDIIWNILIQNYNVSIPEKRAAFDVELKRIINLVKHRSVQTHYRKVFYEKRQELFGYSKGVFSPTYQSKKGYVKTADITLPQVNGSTTSTHCEMLILGYVLYYPALLENSLEDFVGIRFQQEELAILQKKILNLFSGEFLTNGTDIANLSLWNEINPCYTEFLTSNSLFKHTIARRIDAPFDEIKYYFTEILHTHSQLRMNEHEIQDAKTDLCSEYAETASRRLNSLINTPKNLPASSNADDDTAVYTSQLKKIFDDQVWLKKTKPRT